MVEHKDEISAVVFWGTTDDMSWRATKYPLLFNEDYTAKESFYSIVDGLEASVPTETESEPQDTSAPDSEIIWGDADCSGEVDILDVITLNKVILGKDTFTDQGLKNADTNQNNVPDSSDSLNIMKLIVGLLSAENLPVSE